MKKKKTQSKGASAKPQRQKVVNQITIEYLKRRSKELDAMAQSIAFEACSGRALIFRMPLRLSVLRL